MIDIRIINNWYKETISDERVPVYGNFLAETGIPPVTLNPVTHSKPDPTLTTPEFISSNAPKHQNGKNIAFWTEWESWSTCSKACRQNRRRYCVEPKSRGKRPRPADKVANSRCIRKRAKIDRLELQTCDDGKCQRKADQKIKAEISQNNSVIKKALDLISEPENCTLGFTYAYGSLADLVVLVNLVGVFELYFLSIEILSVKQTKTFRNFLWEFSRLSVQYLPAYARMYPF